LNKLISFQTTIIDAGDQIAPDFGLARL